MLVCEICKRTFANKFTLKRHKERIHDFWQSQDEEENEESGGESGTESGNVSSENEDEDGPNADNHSEVNDGYTFAEVRAILRFYCQKLIE